MIHVAWLIYLPIPVKWVPMINKFKMQLHSVKLLLEMVVDLPSPAPALTTAMVLSLSSFRENRRLVRNTR